MQETIAIFPHHILRAGLSRNELLVLSFLLSYRNGDEQVCPSRATIAEHTGINVRQVNRAVSLKKIWQKTCWKSLPYSVRGFMVRAAAKTRNCLMP